MLEGGGRVRQDAAETVDGHEEVRDAQENTMPVNLVELWPVGRKKCGGSRGTKRLTKEISRGFGKPSSSSVLTGEQR